MACRGKNGVADDETADIVQMKAVNVFVDRNGLQHRADRNVVRKRELYKYSMDISTIVECVNRFNQLRCRDILIELEL